MVKPVMVQLVSGIIWTSPDGKIVIQLLSTKYNLSIIQISPDIHFPIGDDKTRVVTTCIWYNPDVQMIKLVVQ